MTTEGAPASISDVRPVPCGNLEPHDLHGGFGDDGQPVMCPGEPVPVLSWLGTLTVAMGTPAYSPINGAPTHTLHCDSSSWVWFHPDSRGVPRNCGVRIAHDTWGSSWPGEWSVEAWQHPSPADGPRMVKMTMRERPGDGDVMSVVTLAGFLS